jgi:predicted glycoside hydrolase/deacetylase ChbG (UPF0249 family)
MVFMADSERAADLARENELDVGLHLNFTDRFTSGRVASKLANYHNKIAGFLTRNRYSQVLYNPLLRKAFCYSYQAQAAEFERLFGKLPSHIDGHHHMHLCANLLVSNLIPAGMKVRRNFSFWPGEKSWLNRAYRYLVDRWLARRYRLVDYFFDLIQCIEGKKLDRVAALAKSSDIELMTHPIVNKEEAYLMSDGFGVMLERLSLQKS